MPGSFRIGTIAGIDIYVNFSWLIILVLLTDSLASGWFPSAYPGQTLVTYLLLGFISAILLFVSVLLHELGHSLVARAQGLSVKSIVLFIFGGVSNIEQEPRTAGGEFWMAVIGPVISLAIGGIAYGFFVLASGSKSALAAILMYLAAANILLGIFNLIPGFPLDGGRVLRAIVWKVTGRPTTATQVATFIGQLVAYLFILWGILQFFSGNPLGGIWLGFIGWFLLTAAQSVRAQATYDTLFKDVTVSQMMNAHPMTVPANISLQKLVDEYFLPQGLRSALVMQGDILAGLITLSDIRHVPREEWPQTPVGFVMKSVDKLHVVSPQQNMKDVLVLMNGRDVNQLPVVENERLVGVLSRDAVIRSLEVRQRLGLRQVRTDEESQSQGPREEHKDQEPHAV
ncbi:site-2 protease family protein [Ktedonosporobacter rubrisoli]|uniref:Zinc metalloprotease n=1 Tax=Ktedonosporobacter rubrisoli TaxID=2509675 RepID=A0A4P6K2H4_KTERU|nr:site-2 protease family protein [Ktedonosporobacter rubrisoli]QBD82215.1 site-2 protease family protein [Ktedonosporobacter rubrisoli]